MASGANWTWKASTLTPLACRVCFAYNYLSGTVVTSFQTYSKFQYFDISNNRFSGTLNAGLAFNSTLADTFNLSVNRLSGAFLVGQYVYFRLLAAPTVISTVLDGNMLTFNTSSSSSMEGLLLENGSLQLNIAMAVAAVVPITCGLLWIALRVDCPCNRYAVRVETLRVSVDSWMRCEVSQKCIQARRALWVAKSLASSGIAVLVLALTLGLLLVLLKSDIFLGSQYSTYQLQYGWTFSAAYLHDTTPVVLCMLCLGATSLLLGAVYSPGFQEPGQSTVSSGI